MMISGRELGSVVSTHVRGPAGTTGQRPVPPGTTGQGADSVVLSSRGAAVARLVSALRSVPDVRLDRVGEVSARLASGRAPSSHQVARQMLSRVIGDHLAAGG